MTPGIKTSEGRIALLKVLVTSVIAVCTAFGVAVPSWLKPDAPWVTIAALVVGGVVTAVYSGNRTSLKKTVAALAETVPMSGASLGDQIAAIEQRIAPTVPEPVNAGMAAGVPTPADAGFTNLGIIGLILLIVGIVLAIISQGALLLLVIGIVVAVIGFALMFGGVTGRPLV